MIVIWKDLQYISYSVNNFTGNQMNMNRKLDLLVNKIYGYTRNQLWGVVQHKPKK